MPTIKPFPTLNSNLDRVWAFSPRIALQVPLYSGKVAAGFPSPADDHIDGLIDFNEYLVSNPTATFLTRASGTSMIGAGIHDGDILVVDSSREARHNDVVVVCLNGDLTCKRLSIQSGQVLLTSDNPDYRPIVLKEGDDMRVWGIVVHSIHKP